MRLPTLGWALLPQLAVRTRCTQDPKDQETILHSFQVSEADYKESYHSGPTRPLLDIRPRAIHTK